MHSAQDLKNLREVIAKLGKDVEVPAAPDAPQAFAEEAGNRQCFLAPTRLSEVQQVSCVPAGTAAVHQRAQLGGRVHRGADAEVLRGAAAGLPDTPAGRGPGAAEQGGGAHIVVALPCGKNVLTWDVYLAWHSMSQHG